MPVAAIVGAVGAVASAGIGAYASSKAASAQKKAANKASALQKEMWQQSRTDIQPYNELGQKGMSSLAGLFGLGDDAAFSQEAWGKFQETPFYQAPLTEGIRALDSSAAARGNLLSSGQMKRVQQFGQDYAASRFDDYMSRLRDLAGIGANAATRNSVNSMSLGGSLGQNAISAGEAQASGIAGIANNVNQGINNLAYAAKTLPIGGYTPVAPSQA